MANQHTENFNNFLKQLKKEKKSSNSIRGYKSDIAQFLLWVNQENVKLSHKHLSVAKEYRGQLKPRYKSATVERKLSSVNAYLTFTFPREKRALKTSKAKLYQRNAMLLGAYTIVLVALVMISPIFYSAPNLSNSAVIDEGFKTSKANGLVNAKSIKVSVSAPEVLAESSDGVNLMLDSQDYAEVINTAGKHFGKSSIKAGQTTSTISSTSILEDSVVMVTPTSQTLGEVLFIERQVDGSFSVSVQSAVGMNIDFNWYIVGEVEVYQSIL